MGEERDLMLVDVFRTKRRSLENLVNLVDVESLMRKWKSVEPIERSKWMLTRSWDCSGTLWKMRALSRS